MKTIHRIVGWVMVCLLVACGDSTPPATAVSTGDILAKDTPTPAGQVRVALIMKTLTNPFFIEMEKGARRGVEDAVDVDPAVSRGARRGRWRQLRAICVRASRYRAISAGHGRQQIVGVSYGICTYILFVPAIVYAGQPLQIGLRELMPAIVPPLIGALIAEGVGFTLRTFYLSDLSSIQRMAALIVVCVTAYALITVGMFRMTKPMDLAKRLLSDLLPNRLSRMLGLGIAH